MGKYHDPVEDPEGEDLVPGGWHPLLLLQDALLLHPPPPWIKNTDQIADTTRNTDTNEDTCIVYRYSCLILEGRTVLEHLKRLS